MQNTCWDCKHNTLKLKILVPYNHTIKEYMHSTLNFQSDIVAVLKEKREQYTVCFRQDGDKRLVTFKFLQICGLKLEKPPKDSDCPSHNPQEGECVISNIIYSKLPSPQEHTTELMPVLDSAPFLPIEHK